MQPINHYPADNSTIHWIEICPVDSANQPLNNRCLAVNNLWIKTLRLDLSLRSIMFFVQQLPWWKELHDMVFIVKNSAHATCDTTLFNHG